MGDVVKMQRFSCAKAGSATVMHKAVPCQLQRFRVLNVLII